MKKNLILISIRQVQKPELEMLLNIAESTFLETYSAYNSPSNMATYIAENFNLEKITQEFSNPESQFYFARNEEEVIGYLKLNTGDAQTESGIENSVEIERIYIRSAYQGRKVGRRLLHKALEVASAKGLALVWLGVWEKNPKAIEFYKRFGFIEFGRHIFKFADEDQVDILMKFDMLK